MEAKFDSTFPCLFCDQPVLVSTEGWTPAHVALCMPCFQAANLQQVRMMFFLRCRIAGLENVLQRTGADVQKLFTAQQELEVSLLSDET